MDGLSQSLEHALINNYALLKEVNEAGHHKLVMNVACLELVLALVCPLAESHLARCRAYYHLAKLNPAELIEAAAKSPFKFTTSQYVALLDVHYGGLELGEEEAVKKEYQSMLVKLQYLTGK